MAAELVLVRHGQTHVNRSGCFQGRLDPALTDAGRAQAQAAARGLAEWPLTDVRVVSSPLQRARETAAFIAAALGASVGIDDRLVELDYGDWDGRPLAQVTPDEWAAWQADPTFAPPGGESLRDVAQRVEAFVHDVLATPTTTIAVSHVSPIKAAVCLALGADERATWRMHLDLASITRISARGEGAVLRSYNEVVRLDGATAAPTPIATPHPSGPGRV